MSDAVMEVIARSIAFWYMIQSRSGGVWGAGIQGGSVENTMGYIYHVKRKRLDWNDGMPVIKKLVAESSGGSRANE